MTIVALVQGVYFFLSGVWPLLHMRSFLTVTGRKTDLWLVKTVAALIVAIGLGLLIAGIRHETPPPVVTIAVGSAAGLIAIDVTYVRRRTIAPVYLLDAAAEAGLILWWIVCWLKGW